MKKGNDHLIYFNTVMVLYFCIVEFSASNIQIDISRRERKKKKLDQMILMILSLLLIRNFYKILIFAFNFYRRYEFLVRIR